ncbi:MAG: hypothetical protein ACR2PI_01915 [Hyphomicrobiaceae bacterium]
MFKTIPLKSRSFANLTCSMVAAIGIFSTATVAGEEVRKSGIASLTKPELALPKRTRIETERRVVASGVSTVVLSLVALDAECNSVELPEIEIISAPKHGRTRVIAEEDIVRLGKDSLFHKKCSNKNALLTRLYYRSTPGFRGGDTIIARGTWTELSYGTRTFKLVIDVR